MWSWWSSASQPINTTTSSSSSSKTTEMNGYSLTLEEKLQRVTANDIAHVTVKDVERVKRQVTPEELQRAMRVMLEDNRYAEVIASASSSSLRAAATDLTAVQRHSLTIVTKTNLLALYNVLSHVTERHLAEINAIFGFEN
ncbi:uncharacterized protein TM35_000351250 [Trypanosoma theileri]|uniref:Uncharacterized protein n=1 Tax=Trypanosoma theileri TaxID=67003 RepID=A0A1X0NLC3_9TRYP|nr:uncharacterized protein TM35_000351250 [Trypanosoma theileri]ORC85381.1 hypothetical protein TM35_000351250 [Trypanosoma theileri]